MAGVHCWAAAWRRNAQPGSGEEMLWLAAVDAHKSYQGVTGLADCRCMGCAVMCLWQKT